MRGNFTRDRNYSHGGNGKTAEQVKAMQEKLVDGVLSGAKPYDAAIAAGYAPSTVASGSGISDLRERIRWALEQRGITHEKLAKEYEEGLELAKSEGARDIDLHSHAQYLKQLGWLLGATNKQTAVPAVAVQVNNSVPNGRSSVSVNGQPVGGDAALHEPGGLEAATRAALEQLQHLREDFRRVEEEIVRREPVDLHVGDARTQDPSPHP